MNVVVRRPGVAPGSFFTLKATEPIQIAGPLSHDHLVQASLDPTVERITYVGRLPLLNDEVRIEAPVLDRSDGSFVQLLEEHHPERDRDRDRIAAAISSANLGAEVVSSDDIGREPRASTARVVWRQRHTTIGLTMRLALSYAFADDATLTVDELCRRVPGPRDPILQIMALACHGLLRIDLSNGFDGDTIVRGPR